MNGSESIIMNIPGEVLYPIIFHKLQPEISFGWSTRVIAFIIGNIDGPSFRYEDAN